LFPVKIFPGPLAWRFYRLRGALTENGDNTTRANQVKCSRHRPWSGLALPKAWEEYPVSQQLLDPGIQRGRESLIDLVASKTPDPYEFREHAGQLISATGNLARESSASRGVL
jgi:hypothetical protein